MKYILAICCLITLIHSDTWALRKEFSTSFLSTFGMTKDTVFLDLKNDPDFQFKKDLTWYQDENLALFGIKDNKGDIYIEPLFHQIESFVEGISIVSIDHFQGAINTDGEVIIPFAYEELLTSSEYKIAYSEGDKWGFLDTNGQVVIPAQYDFVGSYSDGLALASSNQLFGYIDHRGKVVIPFQYEYASNFENGQAQVEIKFQSFTINKHGTKVYP